MQSYDPRARMNDIAAMVSELIASGADPAVAASVVAAAFVAGAVSGGNRVDTTIEKRRAWDREYRRNKRENPPDSTRFHPTSESASLSKEEKKEVRKEGSKGETTRGARLPVGWKPTDQDWAIACELVGEPKAKTELEKFIDHWKQQPGPKGVKLDWNAGWRNWIRRASEYAGGKNGVKPHLSQHQIERENSRKILNDLDQFIGGGCNEADPGLLRHDSGDRPAGIHGGNRRDVIVVPATRVGKGGEPV